MKKIILIIIVISFLTSCSVEMRARLGGVKAPKHRRCWVGNGY